MISTKAVLKARVADAAVKSADDPDSAVVLLLVDSTLTSSTQPAPRHSRARVRLTLRQTGDRWLVDRVQPV